MENVNAETVNYIKNIFQNDFSGHEYFHSLQVQRVARAIAEQENADREIVSKIGMVKEEYQGYVTISVDQFYEKLFLLKDMMNTNTGKKIAEKREEFMRAYVDEFMAEWDGKDADYEVEEHFDRGKG